MVKKRKTKTREKKLEEEIDKLKKQIKELKKKADSFEANWKRALADYQNLEKRVVSQRAAQARLAAKDLLISLLPIFDSLHEAVLHLKDEGLSLVFKQLMKVLKDNGVRKIETKGKRFDPNIMEAVEVVESKQDNLVVREVRQGYYLHDTLLRPAQVVVGKRKIT